MIEVLCVTTKLCVGGVQTYLINGIKPLQKLGIQLNFAVQTEEPQVFDEYVHSLGCRIFHVTSLVKSKIGFMKDIRYILRSNPEFSIVHAHQNFANVYSMIAAMGLAKTISHSHNNYRPKSLLNAAMKGVFKLILPFIADAYWACSDDAAKWLYGWHSSERKCHVIRNAVETEKFKFDILTRNRIRKELNLNDKLVWIHVGTLSPAKNHRFLIDLFSESLKNNPNQHMLICGDGILRRDIEEQIDKLGLKNHISLLGNILNSQDYLSASDIYVFPSIFEGMPLSIIEAQANGIPVLCSTAIPQQCIINPNIFRVDELSISAYLKYIRDVRYLSFNREDGAININKSGFSIENEAKKIAQYYKEVL